LQNQSLPACGDGIVQGPEACDAGADVDSGCAANCTLAAGYGEVSFTVVLTAIGRRALDSRLTPAGFPRAAFAAAVAAALGVPTSAVAVLTVTASAGNGVTVSAQALAPISRLEQMATELLKLKSISFDGLSTSFALATVALHPSMPSVTTSHVAKTAVTTAGSPNVSSSKTNVSSLEANVSTSLPPSQGDNGGRLGAGQLAGVVVGSVVGTALLMSLIAALWLQWSRSVQKKLDVTSQAVIQDEQLPTLPAPQPMEPPASEEPEPLPLPSQSIPSTYLLPVATSTDAVDEPPPGAPGSRVWTLWRQSMDDVAGPVQYPATVALPVSMGETLALQEAQHAQPVLLSAQVPRDSTSAAPAAFSPPPPASTTGGFYNAMAAAAAAVTGRGAGLTTWASGAATDQDTPSQPIVQCDICLELPPAPGDAASQPLSPLMHADALRVLADPATEAAVSARRSDVVRLPRFDEPSRPLPSAVGGAVWSAQAAQAQAMPAEPPAGWYAGFADIIDDVLLQTDPGFADIIDSALEDVAAGVPTERTGGSMT
jgi:cysteine-rich repeat protein